MNTISKEAKCVFEGILYDVYQWEQEQFDGSTKTFEALKRKSSVVVIGMTRNKQIIMIREMQPTDKDFGYSLVGGGCDSYDEDPVVAAKRELLEETGMVCEDIKLFKKTTSGGKINWDCYYFIAYECKKVQEQELDSGEKIEVFSVNFDTFLELVEDSSFRNTYFRDMIFRIKYTPNLLQEFKKKLRLE